MKPQPLAIKKWKKIIMSISIPERQRLMDEFSEIIGKEFKLNIFNQFNNYEDAIFHLRYNFRNIHYELMDEFVK